MEETQWIDWPPKVGDIKPEKYRFHDGERWVDGEEGGLPVNRTDAAGTRYQIPAPVVTPPEDRPPWIDPQCKFRWGDRVRDRNGRVWYVINPEDKTTSLPSAVLVGKTLSCAVPYSTMESVDILGLWSGNNIDAWAECGLTLFPEELPQHFDDRLLDADQPQEQPRTTRVPREIWVTVFADASVDVSWGRKPNPPFSEDTTTTYHFREVLPDDLSNIQYSPGG